MILIATNIIAKQIKFVINCYKFLQLEGNLFVKKIKYDKIITVISRSHYMYVKRSYRVNEQERVKNETDVRLIFKRGGIYD